jgi:hypothetical protein
LKAASSRQSTTTWKKQSPGQFLAVKDCHSIEDLLLQASKKIETLSPSDMAAIWSHIPRLLSKSPAQQQADQQKIEQQVHAILTQTKKSVRKLRPKELTTIILGMAKIVQNVKGAKKEGKNQH